MGDTVHLREPLGISNSNCPLLSAPHPQNFLQLVEERHNYFCLLISILCKPMNPLLLLQIRCGWPDLWSRSAAMIFGTLHWASFTPLLPLLQCFWNICLGGIFPELTWIEAVVLDGVEYFLFPGVLECFLQLKRADKGHDFFRKKNSNSIFFFTNSAALQAFSARSRTQEILREPLENRAQLCKVCRHDGSKSFLEYPLFHIFDWDFSFSFWF